MSWQAYRWVSTFKRGAVTGNMKLVLFALADFADAEGRHCHPSFETIADLACLSRRAVVMTIQDLEAAGLISIDGAPGERGGRAKSNNYRLNMAQPGDGETVHHVHPNGRDRSAETVHEMHGKSVKQCKSSRETVHHVHPTPIKNPKEKEAQGFSNAKVESGRSQPPVPKPQPPIVAPARAAGPQPPPPDNSPRVRPGVLKAVIRNMGRAMARPPDPKCPPVAVQQSMLLPIPGIRRPQPVEPVMTPEEQIAALNAMIAAEAAA